VQIPPNARSRPSAPPRWWATEVFEKFPFVDGIKPMADDLTELVLNRTWRPQLSVTA
jgi:hypothetical protein